MIPTLLAREVSKQPASARIKERILFLTEEAQLMKEQLAGADLEWNSAIRPRDNISTDEITPAYICYHYDEHLGEFPCLGLKCSTQEQGATREEFPVTRGSVKKGGFVASVAGKRRGKGFRVQAPGIREPKLGAKDGPPQK
jgi:3-isopropylmalate/(R)-2-methylmalate dehydratase large subunit